MIKHFDFLLQNISDLHAQKMTRSNLRRLKMRSHQLRQTGELEMQQTQSRRCPCLGLSSSQGSQTTHQTSAKGNEKLTW